jgi:hypothetical protein
MRCKKIVSTNIVWEVQYFFFQKKKKMIAICGPHVNGSSLLGQVNNRASRLITHVNRTEHRFTINDKSSLHYSILHSNFKSLKRKDFVLVF